MKWYIDNVYNGDYLKQQWCWIALHKEEHQFLNLRFFTFLVVYICVVLCVVFFVGVCFCFRLHRKRSGFDIREGYQKLGKRTIINFSLILLAFFITWIPAFINRLVGKFDFDMNGNVLERVHNFCTIQCIHCGYDIWSVLVGSDTGHHQSITRFFEHDPIWTSLLCQV